MPKLDREQVMAVGALALLLLFCACMVGLPLQARSDAVKEAYQRREMLSRLEARLKAISDRPTATAPASAFLDASTQALANAQLQSYLAQLARDQNAALASAGPETVKHEDMPDTIRLQATIEMNSKVLRAMLYQLESGTPYVFVDAIAIQPVGGVSGRAAEDPLLRTTLSLRAYWRRGSS
jgi:general secretion pathway protein M